MKSNQDIRKELQSVAKSIEALSAKVNATQPNLKPKPAQAHASENK